MAVTRAATRSLAGRARLASGVPRAALPTAIVAVLAVLLYWASSASLIDDAYITLSYAKNVGLHLHWGLVPSLVDNTATSPLHVLVLGLLIAVVRHGVLALGISFVLWTVATEYGLRRAATKVGLPAWVGLLATVLVLLNPLVLSTIGMEVMPGAALVSFLLVAAVERRPWWFGVLTGLLVITRADFVIIAVVVFLLRRRFWTGGHKSVLAAVVTAAAWYVPSWFLLGSLVPDTLVIKTLQHDWNGYLFGNGPLQYLGPFPVATVLAFLPAVAGTAAFLAWCVARPTGRGARLGGFAALPVAGLVHYGAYAALGVPPYHWYYGPVIVLSTMFLAAAAGAVSGSARARRAAVAVPLAALLLADAVSFAAPGLPRRFAPITSNRASTATYRQIGLQLADIVGDKPVQARVEIGIIDYYCACKMYGYFSDRGYFPAALRQYEHGMSGPARTLVDWNYTHLDRSRRPAPTEYTLVALPHPSPAAVRNWRVWTPWTYAVPQTRYIALLRD